MRRWNPWTSTPNEREKGIVNFAFDAYLRTGSILETAQALNQRGYRTKEYTSRRGRHHPAKEFTWSPVHWLLTNLAYIGKKEINKKNRGLDQSTLPEEKRYRLVDAAWPPIVAEEKFEAVQKLMATNDRTNRNQVRPVRHTYIFNGGLLWCGKCGTQMEGRSGTGQKRARYYYYICRKKECRFKVPADEIERVVLERIQVLSKRQDILTALVEHTNERLQKELPELRKQRKALERELAEVQATADSLLSKWAEVTDSGASTLLRDKLERLGKRRTAIESGIESLETMIGEIQRDAVSRDLVLSALERVAAVFKALPPHQQKELIDWSSTVQNSPQSASESLSTAVLPMTTDCAQ